jgi:uncharacterized protein YeaO (DUF488 family)
VKNVSGFGLTVHPSTTIDFSRGPLQVRCGASILVPAGEDSMIRIKRAYEAAEKADGDRFLVDRLWPRGVKKEALAIKAWTKDAAPSDTLRHWYHNNTGDWTEFRRRYFVELEKNPAAWQPLLEAAHDGAITLLYSSKNEEHNNAVALKEFLENRFGAKKKG